MVRFARAHGSKSSNERQPEEASSWQDLKQQLLKISNEIKNGGQTEKQITKKVHNCETENAPEWAEFEKKPHGVSKKVKKQKKSEKSEKDITTDKLCKHGRVHKNKLTKSVKAAKKMDKKLQKMLNNLSVTEDPTKLSKTVTDKPTRPSLSKRQRRKNREAMKTSSQLDLVSNADIADGVDLAESSLPLTTKQMKTAAILDVVSNADVVDEVGPASLNHFSKRQLKRMKQLKKKRSKKIDLAPPDTGDTANASVKRKSAEIKSEDTPMVMLSKRQKRNQKLAKEGVDISQKAKAHKRRKPNQGTKVLINGQEVEIVSFDGFPILKQDADNLTELRKQMVANGIPEEDIKRAIKLERRKAEKNLAREKKKVCFHCRQSGHNLSECPELGDGSNQDVPGSGICFKCGSTEHTHFECRVNRGQEFRFAKCFICNEQGHISRQCPDNPRGLYPKGGGCKVCGDVTHLKKDCPDLISKKEEQNITLEIESLDQDIKKEEINPFESIPNNKIIKF